MRIPRAWTDVGGGVEQTRSVADTVATTDSLRKFARLLDALLERT